MKFPPLELRSPKSVAEALNELARLGSDARILAGGQSLLPLLRYRVFTPYVLVDINAIEELGKLELGRAIQIGALVRHSEVEHAPVAVGEAPVLELLREHAKGIAFWPIRTRGTVVGSILHADPKGDWPLLFFALDATVELRSARGNRNVPVREFLLGPLETSCAVDELASRLTVSADRAAPLTWGRSKLIHRAGEYAMCSAIVLQYSSGWECWLGAVGDRPILLTVASGLLDKSVLSCVDERNLFLHTVIAEIGESLSHLSRAETHRHARNIVEAALCALRKNNNE